MYGQNPHFTCVFLQLTCFRFISARHLKALSSELKLEWNAPECNSSRSMLKDHTIAPRRIPRGGAAAAHSAPCLLALLKPPCTPVVAVAHRRSRAWWHFRKPLVLIRFRWSIEPSPPSTSFTIRRSKQRRDAKPEYVKAFCGFCQKHFAVSDCDHSYSTVDGTAAQHS